MCGASWTRTQETWDGSTATFVPATHPLHQLLLLLQLMICMIAKTNTTMYTPSENPIMPWIPCILIASRTEGSNMHGSLFRSSHKVGVETDSSSAMTRLLARVTQNATRLTRKRAPTLRGWALTHRGAGAKGGYRKATANDLGFAMQGASYRGEMHTTRTGRTCVPWDQGGPWGWYTADWHPDAGLTDNFCRYGSSAHTQAQSETYLRRVQM